MILRGKNLKCTLHFLKFLPGLKSKVSSSNLEYLKILMKVRSHVEVAYFGTAH